MRNKYLLGATKDRELVFGEFEITNRNDYPEFTASFNTVRPFKESDVDLEDYFADMIDDYGKEWAYDQCESYHCAPQELAKNLADDCQDPRDAMDYSLYSEAIEIDDEWWYFESSCCGQYDTRKEMDEYVDKRMYDLLHNLWDKYHLKNINKYGEESNVIESVKALDSALSKCNEEEWITNYIRRNF